jgi:transcriptional regulator with XRE-family HTH domain
MSIPDCSLYESNPQSRNYETHHRRRGYSNVVPIASNDPTRNLATRIKAEREVRGWTLAELAERSGVSRAMIAKVEAGKSSPTAMLLGKLSGAFGITISTLLARAEDVNHSRALRHDQRLVWRDPQSGYVRRQVFPIPGSIVPIDLVEVELPAGAKVAYPASSYSFAKHLILVQKGRLVFVEGRQEHLLRAGDCLELGEPQECRYENRSGNRCTYLVLLLRETA